jgi:4-hydroxybenzoate polyprenyltransferase
MSLQEIFLIFGILYFSIWLIIAIAAVVFIAVMYSRIKKEIEKFKKNSKPAQIALGLAKSALLKKALVAFSGAAFATKAVSSIASIFSSKKKSS